MVTLTDLKIAFPSIKMKTFNCKVYFLKCMNFSLVFRDITLDKIPPFTDSFLWRLLDFFFDDPFLILNQNFGIESHIIMIQDACNG